MSGVDSRGFAASHHRHRRAESHLPSPILYTLQLTLAQEAITYQQALGQISAFAAAAAAAAIGRDVGPQSDSESKSESKSESEDQFAASKDDATDNEDPVLLRLEVISKGRDQSSDRELEPNQPASHANPYERTLLSTWSPRGNNVLPLTDKAVAIKLQPKETVTFIGQYDVWVKSGSVKLYGALLHKSKITHRVFAPSTHALPSIACHGKTFAEVEIWSCNHSMRPLGDVSPLFRRLWNQNTKQIATGTHNAALQKHTFTYLKLTSNDVLKRALYPLVISPLWMATIQTVSKPLASRVSKIVICGAKSSGKSTFARVLTNYLITSNDSGNPVSGDTVCWLDLDPGQPEFTPSGQVSLTHIRKPNFGPPFSHAYTDQLTPFRSIRAHALGALSPKEDASHFLKCAGDLLSAYGVLLQRFPKCSLIINCPGWITGSGIELLTQLISICAATDIVFMDNKFSQEQGTHRIFQFLEKAAGVTPVHKVSTALQLPPLMTRTAVELRAMQSLSYFHQTGPKHSHLRWSANTIDKQRPWKLRFAGSDRDVLGIMNVGEQPNPDFLFTVLQGSLVAVCLLEDDSDVRAAMVQMRRTETDALPFWPFGTAGFQNNLDPSKSHMLGFALVQEIDTSNHSLKLQTPLPQVARNEATARTKDGHSRLVLVRGGVDTPAWAYLETQYASDKQVSRHRKAEERPLHDAEELAVRFGELPSDHRGSGDEIEGQIGEIPWVRMMRAADSGGQRWRIRKNIGRPVPGSRERN